MVRRIFYAISAKVVFLFAALALCRMTAHAQVTALSFRPVDARYSAPLERIVMISSNPGQLHIYDPLTGNDAAINLAKPALSLSISPDGLHAVVGHDQLASYIDLTSRTVLATYPITFTANTVTLGDTEFDAFNAGGDPHSYIQDLQSSAHTGYNAYMYVSSAAFDASARRIYYTDTIGGGLRKLDVTTPITSASLRELPYPFVLSQNAGGKVWLTANNSRIYTNCSAVFGPKSDGSFPFTFITTLEGNPHVEAVAEAPGSSTAAVIPDAATTMFCQTTPHADDHIVFYDTNFFRQTSQVALLPFSAPGGSFPAHGRFLFYNSTGTKLFVVAQADSTANLPNDYAVETFDFSNSTVCAPSPSVSTISVPASGVLTSVDITADASCRYQSSSDASWVQIISGGNGSGNQTVKLIVRTNTTTSPRTANLTIGSQKVVISQAASAGFSNFMPLGFQVLLADYSKSLDRAILAPYAPNELHIYDASTGADQIVALPLPPSSIGVSPDGLHAAVGHEGSISLVNLVSGAVEKTLPVGGAVPSVAVTNSGVAYFSRYVGGAHNGLFSLDFNSGVVTTISSAPIGPFRLDPSGTAIYGGGYMYHLGDQSPLGFPPTCGSLWFADDGSEATTACGQIYSLPSQSGQAAQYLGSLVDGPISSANASLTWAADSSSLRTTAVIPYRGAQDPQTQPDDTQIRLFSDIYHSLTSQSALPSVSLGAQTYASHGRFLFWNKASDRLIVFTQPDASAPSLNSSVAVYAPSLNAPACVVTPGSTTANVTAQGNFGSLTVNSADGCAWTATSSAAWLTITGGTFGLGSGIVDYVAGVNPTTSPRTATITINSSVITVTQPGAAGTVSLTPTSANSPASGGAGLVFVTSSSPSLAWTVTQGSSWITVNSALTNTGNAEVSYIVAPAPTTSSRTGTFAIQGQVFTVTQAGATVTVSPAKTQYSPYGDSTTVTITSDSSALPWNPHSDASWITFTTAVVGAPQSGSGQLTLNVSPIESKTSRSATVTIAGQSFMVTQSGVSVTLVSPGAQFGPSGGSALALTTGGNLPIQAVSNADWITVVGTPQVGAVSYTVSPYSGGPPRVGTITIAGLVYTVVQNGTDPIGYRFVPMTPCRAVDTRTTDAPAFNAFGSRRLSLYYSCGVPTTAVAYSVNVTVLPVTKLDFFTLWPSGQPLPEVSTLNSYDGRVVANAAIVPVGDLRQISAYATDATHVIIDINGYFDAVSPQGLDFFPGSPCRALDTRNGDGPLGGPGLSENSRSFQIQASACKPPASAQAYSLNVTAVPKGKLNYLTVWPTGQSQPFASTLNSYDGSVVANAVITPVGTNGSVSAFASGSTDIIMDLNGYFAPPNSVAGVTGLKFYPVKPCRVADTRNPNGPLGAPALAANANRTFPIAGTCGVPAAAQAFALNVTVVPKTNSLHFLTLWPSGHPKPEASTLNSYQGKVLANAAIVPAGVNGSIDAFATDDTDVILDVNGYFAP